MKNLKEYLLTEKQMAHTQKDLNLSVVREM